jgi:hypothetical protein
MPDSQWRKIGRSVFITMALLCLMSLVAAQEKKVPATLLPAPTSPHTVTAVSFSDVTRSSGLSSFQHTSGAAIKDYIIEATGSGCAFLDYDNDGWLDVYLVNGSTMDSLLNVSSGAKAIAPSSKSALFHNNQDGTFTNLTDKAGVANERFGQGVCAGDYDNDGWLDLYVTNYGKNRLYHNNGDGTFTDVAEKAGVALGKWSTGCAFGDYNGDGLLDLFVAGYIELNFNRLPPAATDKAESTTSASVKSSSTAQTSKPDTNGMGATYSAGVPFCAYRNVRVMCGPRGLKGAPDHLFRNNGDGTFTDVSVQAGVSDKTGYYGFGVAWFDLDDDGRLDLIVANDSTPNSVYRNNGDGTFEDVSYSSGAGLNEHGREQAHMGVAIGDYNSDGRTDIHITNFADDSNVLYRNDGGGNFSDVTYAAGIGEASIPFLGWGTNFFDYDNDSALDLLVANGHVYPVVDEMNWNTSYKQRLLLFRNVKNKFHSVGAGAAMDAPRASRGSATGDFDNDGDEDILLCNIDQPPALLRNDGANRNGNWLTIQLIGDPKLKCPRDAIGSVIFCTANGRRQRGEVASGRSYNSQSDLRIHFGLGTADKVEKLEVRWASGKTMAYEISGVNKFLTIDQSRGIR